MEGQGQGAFWFSMFTCIMDIRVQGPECNDRNQSDVRRHQRPLRKICCAAACCGMLQAAGGG